MTFGPGPWCGTPNGYTTHRCRCDQCRKAWTDYHRSNGYRNQNRYRDKFLGARCAVEGCGRRVTRAYPSHGLCDRHLRESKATA